MSDDPNEEEDLSLRHPGRAASMLAEVRRINETTFSPHRGTVDVAGACAAAKAYGGFWGPWLHLSDVAAEGAAREL